MWKTGTLLASCAMLSLGLSLPSSVKADDDWDDYYEDLEDAREDYYDDLEDYYDDLDDRRVYRYGHAPRVYYGPSYRSYGNCQPYGSYYSPGYRSVYYGPRYYSRPRVGVWIGRW